VRPGFARVVRADGDSIGHVRMEGGVTDREWTAISISNDHASHHWSRRLAVAALVEADIKAQENREGES
jgi:hypothetical protein